MKLIKRLGKIIVALIAILFIGILVCALQPSLTEKLSNIVAAHYGQKDDSSQESGTDDSMDVSAEENAGTQETDADAGENVSSKENADAEEIAGTEESISAEASQEATPAESSQTPETEVVIKPMEWDEEKKNMPYLPTEESESSDGTIDTMDKYYQDCKEQMVAVGTGEQQFTNEVPEELWSSIENAYSDGSYRSGYVNEALQKMGVQNFAIQLQAQRLGNGKYRIYHNISTW